MRQIFVLEIVVDGLLSYFLQGQICPVLVEYVLDNGDAVDVDIYPGGLFRSSINCPR
jgi:hypothetical protein